jgi:transposase InsO family protein
MPVNGTKMAYKGLVHFCPAFSELTVNRFSGTLCLRDSDLDDFSRFIVAWKLCATMKAEDVTETLNLAYKWLV